MNLPTDPFSALREIGSLTNEAVVIFKMSDNTFVYFNDIAIRMLGITSDLKMVNLEDLLDRVMPEDRDYIEVQFRQIKEFSSRKEIEFRIGKDPETSMAVCCNAYLLFDKQYLVTSLRDISRAKQHEDYMVEFGTRKNTMLDTLVHHISSVLNLTKNLTVEAGKSVDTQNIANVKTYLELVINNNEQSIDMINALIKDEFTEASKIYLKTTRINVVPKIEFIHRTLQQTYISKKFTFNFERPHMFVVTDEFKVLQIINNFTSNALKFTHDGGEIIISVYEQGKEIVMSVADNGIGIPEEMKPYIFDRATLTSRPGLNGEASTGLGLSINKKLTEIIGGRIWFESAEGEGSAFYLAIPFE